MADGPCMQAEAELDAASRQYAEAVNAMRRLTSAEPKGSGAKRTAWEAKVSEARRVRDSALELFQQKSEALQKCKADHGLK